MPAAHPEWTMIDFIHRGPWFRHRGILMLNLLLILPLLTAWSNGLDSSLVNGLQLLPAWENYFNHPKGKTLGLLNSSQNIGSLAGLPFAPFLADRLGRRSVIFIGSCIMCGGVAMQTLATTVQLFIGARVLLGFGLTFCLTGSPLLITELAYPTQRGRLSGFYNSCWYVGSIANAWTVYAVYSETEGIWTWKIPTIVQAAAPLLQVLFIWFLPESPRWLASRGLESQAASVLARFHAHGDTRDPLVIFELAQIRHALRSEKEVASKQPISVLWATPGNRKRMAIIIAIAMFSQWSGNGLVSYYSNIVFESVGIVETKTKAALNGGLQIWNLACAMTGAFLVERLGRRTLFLISNTGMLVVFSIWTVTVALYNDAHIKNAGKATVPFIFIFYLFYDLAYTPLLIAYSLEILPFHIRAKGFTVLNLTVALTIAFNQFVNPWALEAIGWWYYLVYVGFLVFELFFIWKFIIETKGRTLEETAALFDGEPVDLVEAGGEAATTASAFHPVYVGSHGPYDDPEKPPSSDEHKQSSRFENIEMASIADSDYSGFEVREEMRRKRMFDDPL